MATLGAFARWERWLWLAPYVSLAVLMSQSGLVAFSRIIAPFYALLLPLWLAPFDSARAVRSKWWHALAAVAFAFAFIALVLSPARPLYPAQTLFTSLQRAHPSPAVKRARTTYSVYAHRHDVLAPVREIIPGSAGLLGLVTISTPETSLWRPFFHRRIVRLGEHTSADEVRGAGMEYAVVETAAADLVLSQPFAQWLRTMNATVITNLPIRLLASQEPMDFAVVRFEPEKQ